MEVQRHGFLALILAHMQILERSRTASVIHQNIDPTEPGNGRRSKLFRCVFFVQVSGDDHRTMTAFRHNFFGKFTQFVDSAGRHGDADTLGRKCQRDATSDSHADPGDACRFVVKLQVHGGLWGALRWRAVQNLVVRNSFQLVYIGIQRVALAVASMQSGLHVITLQAGRGAVLRGRLTRRSLRASAAD